VGRWVVWGAPRLVLLVAHDRDLALVDLGPQAVERLADLLELGLGGDQPRGGLREVVLEGADDIFEGADLALLRQHAAALRVSRATGDHASALDDAAGERDH